MTNSTSDSILQIAIGFMASKHLFVANELGLFEYLAQGPCTLHGLAQATGAPARNVRIIADAMVLLGVLEKQEDTYQNSPAAATYLSGRSPGDLRPFLRLLNASEYPAWMHLETSVRQGLPAMTEASEEHTRVFSEGIEALTLGTAKALANAYDFGRHQRLLDLGGGTASFLITVLGKYHALEATLFERPGVLAVAQNRLAHTPVSRRITLVAGDFFQDAIPAHHDVVLLANIVHLFSPEHNLELLQRIRSSVPAHTCLLLVDFWMDATHTQPPFAALMAGEFLIHTGEGASYSSEKVRGWLHESKWGMKEHIPLAGPASLMVAEAT